MRLPKSPAPVPVSLGGIISVIENVKTLPISIGLSIPTRSKRKSFTSTLVPGVIPAVTKSPAIEVTSAVEMSLSKDGEGLVAPEAKSIKSKVRPNHVNLSMYICITLVIIPPSIFDIQSHLSILK